MISFLLPLNLYFVMFMNMINLMCWNCRGVPSRDTTSQIFQMLKDLKPLILCLVETRTDKVRLDRLCAKVGRKWCWATIEVEGYLGAIIAIWKKHIGLVTPIVKSRYALHLVISTVENKDLMLSVIYNSNLIQG